MRPSLAIVIAALAAAGCGDRNDIASCTTSTPADAGGTLTVCREIADLPAAEAEFWANSCFVSGTGATAMFEQAPCPRADALGGCRLNAQTTVTYWYYDGGPYVAADVPMLCTQIDATFVAP